MRTERGLHDHLAADLPLQELELRVLGKALGSVDGLSLNLEDLVTDDERLGAIAPFDHLRVALHLPRSKHM